MKFPKHQTVEWWIAQLKEFNPKAVVKLTDGPATKPMCMLSMYYGFKQPYIDRVDNTKLVWIDIGEPD